MAASIAEQFATLEPHQREFVLTQLTDEEAAALIHEWHFWARPNQIAPEGDWLTWLVMAGRGFGKTRCGAEWIREKIKTSKTGIGALIGATGNDVRDVMIFGPAGIMSICPDDEKPEYKQQWRKLVFPNGAEVFLYSALEPDRLRGPQHEFVWGDEIAAWRYAQETWDMAAMGLRLGQTPQAMATTTPRPTKFIKSLVKENGVLITRGSTYENKANLAPTFVSKILQKYEGTRLGRQELRAELLTDTPGALWTYDNLDDTRVTQTPAFKRVVIGIDPAISAFEEGEGKKKGRRNSDENEPAETGIVVAALGLDGNGYILADLSITGTPDEWGTVAVKGYYEYEADRLVPEINQGGDMVSFVIRTIDPNVAIKPVRAAKSKTARAEPVAALYEQKRVHHVGTFSQLEDQLCTWVQGDKSPDRLDALVWALTELMLEKETEFHIG